MYLNPYHFDDLTLQSSLFVPLGVITSELNNRDPWYKKNARKKVHNKLITIYWKNERFNVDLPCIVELVRIAPRKLDDDNLQGALKSIRDCIADLIFPGLSYGRADGDVRIQWAYAQEKDTKSRSGLGINVYYEKKLEIKAASINLIDIDRQSIIE